jgi:Do/DeqQ family serine protease
MKLKNAFLVLLIATIGGVIAIAGNKLFFEQKNETTIIYPANEQISRYASFTAGSGDMDFTAAAEKAVHGVVHIKTAYEADQTYTLYDFFFNGQPYKPSAGSGSGVIISTDGYIVTNNHVIDMSTDIEVVLNDKRSFRAKIIGKDPTTDLALLKIEAKDLIPIEYGNSDDVKVGQWVLAVGNPFNLTSTVTAGIISAKGRNISLLERANSIESFIQTDAAINPGNSGGALVDLKGNLIGVNAAIATNTGSYSGYSFAIPASMVKKIISDLKEYGVVQRALLGVSLQDITDKEAKKMGLDKIEGVLVEGTLVGSSAAKAGIIKDDIILKIDGKVVNSVNELQELISRYRPGDKVDVVFLRQNKLKTVTAVLQNSMGSTDIVNSDILAILGANFEELKKNELGHFGISSGIRVKELFPGKLMKAGVNEGYIITHINKIPVNSISDIEKILKDSNGGVYLKGIYPNGVQEYYAFGLDK